MNKADLKLDWASHKAALYACKRWHYSKTLPTPPMQKIGVWENGEYKGCVIFSRGATEKLVQKYGLKKTQGCELTRIALSAHSAPVSRIIRIALAMIKKRSEGLRLVVSFADPAQGHHGGVYQAGGWLYSGDTAKSKQYTYGGKILHERQVSVSGRKRQYGELRLVPTPKECTVKEMPGKHRYLMPLDEEMRKKIKPLAKPYPKRIKQAMTETIGTAAVQHRPVRSIEAA